MKGVPGKGGAFHPGRVFPNARKDGEFAKETEIVLEVSEKVEVSA